MSDADFYWQRLLPRLLEGRTLYPHPRQMALIMCQVVSHHHHPRLPLHQLPDPYQEALKGEDLDSYLIALGMGEGMREVRR